MSATKIHKVTLLPDGQTLEVSEGKSLLSAIKEAGIYVKSTCGGVASCGDCIVKCTTGAENLSAANFQELKLLGNVFHITKERLSCQTTILGDVTLDISHHDKERDQQKGLNKTTSKKKPGILIRKGGAMESKKTQSYPETTQESAPPKLGGGSRAKKFKYSDEE